MIKSTNVSNCLEQYELGWALECMGLGVAEMFTLRNVQMKYIKEMYKRIQIKRYSRLYKTT